MHGHRKQVFHSCIERFLKDGCNAAPRRPADGSRSLACSKMEWSVSGGVEGGRRDGRKMFHLKSNLTDKVPCHARQTMSAIRAGNVDDLERLSPGSQSGLQAVANPGWWSRSTRRRRRERHYTTINSAYSYSHVYSPIWIIYPSIYYIRIRRYEIVQCTRR